MNLGVFIDGAWRAGRGGRFTSLDPATGETIWQAEGASPADVADAVAAARRAFRDWSRTPFETRRDLVLAFKAEVERRKADLATLISRETGKPRWEGEAEAATIVGKVDLSLKAYAERTGHVETAAPFGRTVLRHRPHGVMAVFGPYNFPGHLPNGHIVPALIAGDTIVFKPSEICPAVGAFLIEAWAAVGAPPGVINLVQGGREVGGALLGADIDGVLFTGSVDTGVMIHRAFAGRPEVILALEMGGNNPLVVWPGANAASADVEAAALIALHSSFITTGQRCSCARRIIVPQGAAGDRIIEALAGLLDRLVIDAWNASPEPFMGPLVTAAAADKTLAAQAALVAQGAKIVREAKRLPAGAAFVGPALVDASGLDVPDREVFGPLATIWREASFEAAIARANATQFGLSAGLISDDRALWDRFALDIRAGVVNWNRPTTGASGALPFGGPGYSGNHRPSAYYAADYCAWPMASAEADRIEAVPTKGLR